MFSYFPNGIENTIPNKTIDLPGLIKLIKNNPQKELLEEIRALKSEGNLIYKDLKKGLSNITPNCIVKIRNLKGGNFKANFKESSHYIYFDTDSIPNLDEYKKYFIERYGHQVSLVCKSSSHGGLSILFKITNKIASKEQFFQVWEEIKTTILADEKIDILCKDIGRAMYVSYDPDLYYNYENEITLSITDNIICTNKKGIKQPITEGRECNNILNDTFYKIIPFNEVMKKICLKTSVYVDKPVVDMIPVDFAEVTFPRSILDNTKHRIYTGMIHSLVYLNPEIEADYIFSYMNFINNGFANPSMEFNKLVRLFRFVYTAIKRDKDYDYSRKRTKCVHFNNQSALTGDEKRRIASKLNGQRRCNDSIKRIREAKEYLNSTGQKVTQKLVAELTSLSIATVKRHYYKEASDLNELVERYNTTIPPRTNKNGFRDGNLELTNTGGIHPDCPEWVLKYIFSGSTS